VSCNLFNLILNLAIDYLGQRWGLQATIIVKLTKSGHMEHIVQSQGFWQFKPVSQLTKTFSDLEGSNEPW
jgi:hypothetical protein